MVVNFDFGILELVTTSIQITQAIHSAVETVRGFKQKCAELEARARTVLAPTKALYEVSPDRLLSCSNTYHSALKDLHQCLYEINTFLSDLSGKGRLCLFLHSREYSQAFVDFNQRLNQINGDLSVGLGVAALVALSRPQKEMLDKRRSEYLWDYFGNEEERYAAIDHTQLAAMGIPGYAV